jgi:DNA-binding winged helix-turn-helix (wHTH) protein
VIVASVIATYSKRGYCTVELTINRQQQQQQQKQQQQQQLSDKENSDKLNKFRDL